MLKLHRKLNLLREGIDMEARTVPATIATDAVIEDMWLGRVSLSHEPGALEEPPEAGIPVIVAHKGENLPVARGKQISIADGQTTSVFHFGESTLATEILRDIANGTITDVSVGAEFARRDVTELDDGTLVANRWKAGHVGIVATGADPAAKLHREHKMSEPKFKVVDEDKSERVAAIRSLFQGLEGEEFTTLRIKALEGDDSVETIRTGLLEKLKGNVKPVGNGGTSDIQLQRDGLDKWKEGMSAVLLHRTGIYNDDAEKSKELDEKARSSEFFGYSLLEMARSYLQHINYDMRGMGREQIAYRACVTRAAGIISHSPGDFTNLVADTQNKTLAQAYEQTPTTFQIWTGTGSLPDKKQADIVNTSSFSDVDKIEGDEEYRYGTSADKKEVAQIETWGKLFSIGRTLILNDDLGGMTRTTQMMARAMARKVNEEVYGLLSANAAMNEDSVALFNAAHGNFVAGGSGAAPSVATLDTAFTAMGTQNALGPDGGAQTGAVLNLTPTYILVPKALEWTTRALLDNQQDPAEGSTTSFTARNPFAGRLQVVADAEIDGDDAAKWYLAASPTQIDTITVHYLNGVRTPTLEQEEGFTRDGVTFKIRFDFDAAVGDFRGLYHNDGN